MKITHLDQLGGSDYIKFAVEAHADLLRTGMASPNVIHVHWEDKAVVTLHSDNNPIGIITYAKQDWQKLYSIKIGYVLPGFRKTGIYKSMWNALVEKAREDGMNEIIGTTKMENHQMRSTALALGRKEYGIILTYKIAQEA
jgi:predicted acetyltransferase